MERVLILASFHERIVAYGLAQVDGSPQDHWNLIAEALFDLPRDPAGNAFQSAAWRAENHVTALDISSQIGASGVHEYFNEIPHEQPILVGEIDSPQQRQMRGEELRSVHGNLPSTRRDR